MTEVLAPDIYRDYWLLVAIPDYDWRNAKITSNYILQIKVAFPQMDIRQGYASSRLSLSP
jgi:hypothetical protein